MWQPASMLACWPQKGAYTISWCLGAGRMRSTTVQMRCPWTVPRNVPIYRPQVFDVRILRELALLIVLFAVVGGGVYATWRFWPSHHSDKQGTSHDDRSEEHTSEPQSPCNIVCRLL